MADLDVPEMEPREVDEYRGADTGAYHYAFGRMDAGDPPVVTQAGEPRPTTTITAWHFGREWANLQLAWHRGGGYSPGLASAWENYAESGGHTLLPR